MIMGGASSMERGGIRLSIAASVDSRTSSVRVCNLMLEGSMRSIFPDEEEARKEDIHNILLEMALFYKEYGLTEGQHRQYADREVTYTPNTPENDTPAE